MLKHLHVRWLLVAIVSLFVFTVSLSAQNPPPPVATPEVSAFQPNADTVIEFYGTVEGIAQTGYLISGQLITTVNATAIPSNLQVGEFVRVRAVAPPDNVLSALEIERVLATPFNGIVMLQGIVNEINGQQVRIGNYWLTRTAQSASLFNPASGSLVLVFARFQTNPQTNQLEWVVLGGNVISGNVVPPVVTPELTIIPPVFTPDLRGDGSIDDGGGDDDNDDSDDDNSGRGSGGDDDNDDD